MQNNKHGEYDKCDSRNFLKKIIGQNDANNKNSSNNKKSQQINLQLDLNTLTHTHTHTHL